MKVAAYIRVSTSLQADEGNSLAAQLRRCAEYARFREWGSLVCLYADEGISGTSMAKRPAMQLLFADIEAGRVDVVIVAKLDRAFRNVRDAAESLERIRKAGATFAILDLQVDTSTAAGEMMFNLLASFGQFESRRIGERIHDTNRHIVASGRHVGGNTPPYGYRRPDKLLVVDDEQAAVVRRIFADFLADPATGAGRLARRLNDEGIHSPSGVLWDVITVFYVLRNPVYVGEVAYGRGPGPRHSQWTTDAGRVRAQGTHEPIIDRATWEAAQDKMLRRRTPGRDTSHAHLYAGLLWCGHCGARVWSKSQGATRQTQYCCSALAKGGRAHCPDSKRIFERVLRDLVTPAVARNLRRAEAAKWIVRSVPRRASQDRNRAWHEERLRRLNQLYLDMGLTQEQYEAQRAAVQEELRQVDRAATAAPARIDQRIAADYAAFTESSVVTMEEKRSVAASFIDRIIVSATAIVIHYHDLQYRGWITEETLPRPLPHERAKELRKRR